MLSWFSHKTKNPLLDCRKGCVKTLREIYPFAVRTGGANPVMRHQPQRATTDMWKDAGLIDGIIYDLMLLLSRTISGEPVLPEGY
jgi:hypothetical protein